MTVAFDQPYQQDQTRDRDGKGKQRTQIVQQLKGSFRLHIFGQLLQRRVKATDKLVVNLREEAPDFILQGTEEKHQSPADHQGNQHDDRSDDPAVEQIRQLEQQIDKPRGGEENDQQCQQSRTQQDGSAVSALQIDAGIVAQRLRQDEGADKQQDDKRDKARQLSPGKGEDGDEAGDQHLDGQGQKAQPVVVGQSKVLPVDNDCQIPHRNQNNHTGEGGVDPKKGKRSRQQRQIAQDRLFAVQKQTQPAAAGQHQQRKKGNVAAGHAEKGVGSGIQKRQVACHL